MSKPKLIRVTTVPVSLHKLLQGQMKFMSEFYEVVAVSGNDNNLLETVARDEGVRVKEITMTRQVTPMKDIVALLKMFRFFKQERPLIVHTHTPKAGIIGMTAAWLAHVPVRLHTVAGLPLMEATGFKRRLLMLVEKIAYRFATGIYPNSSGLYNYIKENRLVPLNKLKVIGDGSSNGIDTDYFSREQVQKEHIEAVHLSLGLKPDDFIFVFIGRLVVDKGINELIRAFTGLAERYKGIKLLLIGPFEPERDALPAETIKQIETDPAVISVGYRSDIRPYLAMSDVMVFPSYREGLPNVPMQACAMDVPVIATDIVGSNEVITDNINGLIVPVKDADALYGAMERIYIDRELRSRLAAGARESIVERYNQLKLWEAIKDEYALQIEKLK